MSRARAPTAGCVPAASTRSGAMWPNSSRSTPTGPASWLRVRGSAASWRGVSELLPENADRAGELVSMDDVKRLDVRLNRLRRWHVEGLLCIGDAAHAMSPVGGVGINLAVQDAVA